MRSIGAILGLTALLVPALAEPIPVPTPTNDAADGFCGTVTVTVGPTCINECPAQFPCTTTTTSTETCPPHICRPAGTTTTTIDAGCTTAYCPAGTCAYTHTVTVPPTAPCF